MKKLFPLLTIIALAITTPAHAVEGVEYVRAHASEEPEWTALALQAAGGIPDASLISRSATGSPTDLARRILALAAVGVDPRPLADALEATVVNGSVSGDQYINDDVFAIMALHVAGRTAQSEPLHTITTFVAAQQHADGGWGVTTLSRSDVDSTAAALQALTSVGQTGATTNALTYLRSQQNTDGGFPFRKPSSTNSASTAWALCALSVAGESLDAWKINQQSPRDALLTFLQNDGGFSWQEGDTATTALLTSYAVLALSEKGFVVATYSPPPPAPVVVAPPPTVSTIAPPASTPIATTPAVAKKKVTHTTPKQKSAAKVLGSTTQLPETGTDAADLFVALVGLCFIHSGFALLKSASQRV